MRSPDAQPLAALELWTAWGRGGHHEWPVKRRGLDGRPLHIYEQSPLTMLWVEPALPHEQVGAGLAWRIAFEGLIVPIHRDSRPVAFLRPIELGELDPVALGGDDLLQCDGAEFLQRRDQVLQVLVAEREKVVLAWRRSLLAILDAYPPAGAPSLHTLAYQEAALLRRLRVSRMRYDELNRLLDVFDDQQELLRRGEEPDEHRPTLRLISHAEDKMLCELRRRGVRSPDELRRLLRSGE